MPIKIPLKPETEKAKDSLDAWRKDIEKTFAVKIPLNANDVNFIKSLDRVKTGAGLATGLLEKGAGVLSKYPELFGETGKGAEEVVKQLKTGAETTLSWATTGATLGSIFPGIGTAVGGIVGGLAGAASATYDWWRGTQDVAQETAKIAQLRKEEEARLKIENQKQQEAYERVKKQWEEQKEANDTSKQFASEFSAGVKKIAEDSAKTDDSWKGIAKSSKEATETISEWLDRTYSAAVRARSEIESLNNSVLDLMQSESNRLGEVSARSRMDRGVTGPDDLRDFTRSRFDTATISESNLERDARERKLKEQEEFHSEQIERYKSYVGMVTSVTGELTSQLEANIAAGSALFTGFGAAAERGVAQVLKALAKEYSVKAIGELAEGLSNLAKKDYPAAGLNFASAAKYGAAATAAAIGGAIVGGDASRRGREQGDSGAAGGGSSASQNRFADPGTQNLGVTYYAGGGPGSTTIYTGDSERQKQEAKRKISEILNVGRPK